MYTVIVADDEEEIRRALVKKMDWNSLGFELVGEASNGAEALELVEKLGPDLLLTDIMMPFIGGIELARQVREVRPSTQIAFLTGYEVFEYAKKAIQYNIISYILKPISSEEMSVELVKIRKLIDKKFEQFRSSEQAREHLDTLSFVMPLLLDGYTHADSKQLGDFVLRSRDLGKRRERHQRYEQSHGQLVRPDTRQVPAARKLLRERPRRNASSRYAAHARKVSAHRSRGHLPERPEDHELSGIDRYQQDL